MKKNIIFLLVCVVLLSGCSKKNLQQEADLDVDFVPIDADQAFGTNFLLACINDSKNIGRGEFDVNFEMATKDLQSGLDMDQLRFICLSFNEKADHKQFKQGVTRSCYET